MHNLQQQKATLLANIVENKNGSAVESSVSQIFIISKSVADVYLTLVEQSSDTNALRRHSARLSEQAKRTRKPYIFQCITL